MSGESPNVILYDVNGQEMSVSNGSAIPAGTSGLMVAGSDGTNSRFFLVDSSGREVIVGPGTAGTPAGGVLSIQGVASGTAVPISGTISITGTVGVTQSTSPWVDNITQFGGNNVVTGTGASGVGIPRVTVSNDSNILATQSGTWTVQQGTPPWTVSQATASNLNATVVGLGTAGSPSGGILSTQVPDTSNTGALNALNAAVSVTLAGTHGAGMQLAAGTLQGTIVPEISYDSGTTWDQTFFIDPSTTNVVSSIVFGSNNTATTRTIFVPAGASNVRVRVSAFTSGTANITVRSSVITEPPLLYSGAAGAVAPPSIVQIGGNDGTNLRALLTDASGHPIIVGDGVAGTPAGGVVSIQGVAGGTTVPVSGTVAVTQSTSPWVANITQFGSNNVVTGTGASGVGIPRVTVSNDSNILATQSGTWTVAQGSANTLANAWPFEITDGTHGPAAVKAASTAAVAADPALVVAVSPNNTVAVTQSTSPWVANITQFGSNNVVTGTGASGVGIPRVTVSNDSNILATQSGTWTVQQGTPPWTQNLTQIAGNAVSTAASGTQKVGIVGNAGATLDSTLTAGTAPTDGLGTLIQYNTTQPAPTNTQTVSLQSDQSGNLLTFPGVQTKTGAAWTSATTINTLQFPTGTTTVGAPIGANAFLVQLDQTTTLTGGAVTFQGTYDGSNWVTIPTNQVLNPQTFAQLTNPYSFVANTNQPFLILIQGFQQIRANLTTLITGTGSVTPFWTSLTTSPAGATNEVQGLSAAGSAPVGNPLYVAGKNTSGNVAPFITDSVNSIIASAGANQFGVQNNATVTTSGSTTITTNDYGAQQINLIVNVTGSITGTTPTITYTIQEVDPGNQTTTMGNSASTSTISAAGVYTALLATTTSNVVQVSWTITGTTPSFGGVYTTVVSKVTPATQTTTTTATSSTPGIGLGYITTSAKTNVALQSATYNEQSANFTGSIVSSSANDTSAGTGARTVTIYWMNAAGTTIGTETATLNGTTAVNLVTTTKCFIEKITVNTVGSGGTNAGNITLFTGAAGAGTAVCVIVAGDDRTFMCHHYVTSGKTCHVTDYTGTTNSTNESLFSIQSASIPVANQVSIQISDWVTGSQTNQTQRTFSSTVNVTGPARLQMFVAPGSTSNMTSYGSFTFYDQ